MSAIDVLVILEIDGLEDKDRFENWVRKDSFKKLEDEEFAYTSSSTTTIITTKTYILASFKRALKKAGYKDAKIIFLLNEIAYPPYIFDHDTDDFELEKVQKSWKIYMNFLKI